MGVGVGRGVGGGGGGGVDKALDLTNGKLTNIQKRLDCASCQVVFFIVIIVISIIFF